VISSPSLPLTPWEKLSAGISGNDVPNRVRIHDLAVLFSDISKDVSSRRRVIVV
jgi:hypothetical protein